MFKPVFVCAVLLSLLAACFILIPHFGESVLLIPYKTFTPEHEFLQNFDTASLNGLQTVGGSMSEYIDQNNINWGFFYQSWHDSNNGLFFYSFENKGQESVCVFSKDLARLTGSPKLRLAPHEKKILKVQSGGPAKLAGGELYFREGCRLIGSESGTTWGALMPQ